MIRSILAIFMLIFVAPIGISIAQSPPVEDSGRCKLTVELSGFETDTGGVRVTLYNSEDGYPTKADKASRTIWATVKNLKSTVVFDSLASGKYAVAVWHDRNDNKKLETNWLGIPNEPLGASNDAKGSFGPPSFEDAAFRLEPPGKTISIKVH